MKIKSLKYLAIAGSIMISGEQVLAMQPSKPNDQNKAKIETATRFLEFKYCMIDRDDETFTVNGKTYLIPEKNDVPVYKELSDEDKAICHVKALGNNLLRYLQKTYYAPYTISNKIKCKFLELLEEFYDNNVIKVGLELGTDQELFPEFHNSKKKIGCFCSMLKRGEILTIDDDDSDEHWSEIFTLPSHEPVLEFLEEIEESNTERDGGESPNPTNPNKKKPL